MAGLTAINFNSLTVTTVKQWSIVKVWSEICSTIKPQCGVDCNMFIQVDKQGQRSLAEYMCS